MGFYHIYQGFARLFFFFLFSFLLRHLSAFSRKTACIFSKTVYNEL